MVRCENRSSAGLMDQRLRRFLIAAAVMFIAALLFLWAIHWMGNEIKSR